MFSSASLGKGQHKDYSYQYQNKEQFGHLLCCFFKAIRLSLSYIRLFLAGICAGVDSKLFTGWSGPCLAVGELLTFTQILQVAADVAASGGRDDLFWQGKALGVFLGRLDPILSFGVLLTVGLKFDHLIILSLPLFFLPISISFLFFNAIGDRQRQSKLPAQLQSELLNKISLTLFSSSACWMMVLISATTPLSQLTSRYNCGTRYCRSQTKNQSGLCVRTSSLSWRCWKIWKESRAVRRRKKKRESR